MAEPAQLHGLATDARAGILGRRVEPGSPAFAPLTPRVTALLVASAAVAVAGLLLVTYVIRLRHLSRAAPIPEPAIPPQWPDVDLLMAVHNERAVIGEALRCLGELDYPADRLRFLVVDGASTDGTERLVRDAAARDPRFRLLIHGRSDKTSQLNEGLRHVEAKWVLVTDADARLEPWVVRRMVAAVEADERVLAVGTSVRPDPSHPLERLYWRLTDRLRLLESGAGCASIVTGPCYLFHSGLIERLPDDVVADDVHVAITAAVRGGAVRFLDLGVTESRSPLDLLVLARHKMRKADAYLREVFRFLPRVTEMSARGREIFLWRAAHLLVVPLLLAGGAAAGIVGLYALGAGVELGVGMAATAAVGFAGERWGRWPKSPWLVLPLAVLLAGVLVTAIVRHPFSRQTAHFSRIRVPLTARAPVPEGEAT